MTLLPLRSLFWGGILKLERKEKKRKEKKELPLESSPHPCEEKGQKSNYTRLLIVRERKRKRKRKEEEEEERAPRFNNGAAFRARGERS